MPLTLANAPPATEAAVIEMGARDRGHIALLCDVARPTIGVVTVVAGAHLEVFGSIDDVARAKGELIEALPQRRHRGAQRRRRAGGAMAARSSAPVRTFGLTAGDVRAEAITLDDELRPSFRLVTAVGAVEVRLGLHGRHQVTNALAAATASLAAGCTLDDVAAGLAAAPELRAADGPAPGSLRRTRPGRLLQRQPHVDGLRPRCARRAAGPPPHRRAGRDGRAGGGLGVGPPGDRCASGRSWASR